MERKQLTNNIFLFNSFGFIHSQFIEVFNLAFELDIDSQDIKAYKDQKNNSIF